MSLTNDPEMTGGLDYDLRELREELSRVHNEKEAALDRLSRTEQNVYALKGELEGVKTMWRKTIDGNMKLTAGLDNARAEVARLTAELEAVAAAGQRDAALAISLYQELRQAREFHPRAMKLIGKRKDFIVIAEDEPYFVDAYMAIRRHEKFIKRWTAEDEQRYREAFTRWHQAQTNALPTPPEQEASNDR